MGHNKLWKILIYISIYIENSYIDHLTCLLHAGQEATVRTRHGTMDWLKLGKAYAEAVYCHSAYLTSKQRTSHEMRGWINHKLESRLPGEITTTSDMQMIPLLDCKEIKQVNPKGNQP